MTGNPEGGAAAYCPTLLRLLPLPLPRPGRCRTTWLSIRPWLPLTRDGKSLLLRGRTQEGRRGGELGGAKGEDPRLGRATHSDSQRVATKSPTKSHHLCTSGKRSRGEFWTEAEITAMVQVPQAKILPQADLLTLPQAIATRLRRRRAMRVATYCRQVHVVRRSPNTIQRRASLIVSPTEVITGRGRGRWSKALRSWSLQP